MKRFRTIMLLGLLLTTGIASPASAQSCVSSREGTELVAQGQVLPFPVAVRNAGLSDSDVVSVRLCQSGGGYVYVVELRQGGRKTIPAN
jgi:hypothetical protein